MSKHPDHFRLLQLFIGSGLIVFLVIMSAFVKIEPWLYIFPGALLGIDFSDILKGKK